MEKTVLKDSRLPKYVGKTMVVVKKDHPFELCVGVGREIDEVAGGDFGLIVDYQNGESGFIFSASEVQLIKVEKTEPTVDEIIEQLAGCNYGPKQIAKYLELPEREFLLKWNDLNSKVRFHYDRGRLKADFEVNEKLLANAKTGNITAAQIFFKGVNERHAESVKNRIFNVPDLIENDGEEN